MQPTTRELADKFLRDEFRIMEKHGGAPQLDPQQYEKLLSDTQKSFEVLQRGRTTKQSKKGS